MATITELRAIARSAESEASRLLADQDTRRRTSAMKAWRIQTNTTRLIGGVFQNGRGFVRQAEARPMQGVIING